MVVVPEVAGLEERSGRAIVARQSSRRIVLCPGVLEHLDSSLVSGVRIERDSFRLKQSHVDLQVEELVPLQSLCNCRFNVGGVGDGIWPNARDCS